MRIDVRPKALSHRLGRSAERGAVATIVALFFGGLVMAGLLALTVDVGNIMWERRQLQNGADAAALSLAATCAKNSANCNPNNSPTSLGADSLVPLIGKNASDGVSGLQASTSTTTNGQCGRATGNASMPTCASASSNASLSDLGKCPPIPTWLSSDAAIPYVETYTISKQADGSTLLPRYFSKMLTGVKSGTTVVACSRAAWGGTLAWPGTPVMPIAISYCEWAAATGANPTTGLGGTYYPGPKGAYPGYDPATNPWPTGSEKEIYTAKTTSSPGCTDFNGHVAPGAFSSLTQSGTCAAAPSDWIQGDPGNDSVCDDATLQSLYRGKEVLIPLFNCVSNVQDLSQCLSAAAVKTAAAGGNKLQYHIVGYAGFYLSAWHFSSTPDFYQRSLKPPTYKKACPAGSDRCISGWFTQPVIGSGSIAPPGTRTFGPTVVVPAG